MEEAATICSGKTDLTTACTTRTSSVGCSGVFAACVGRPLVDHPESPDVVSPTATGSSPRDQGWGGLWRAVRKGSKRSMGTGKNVVVFRSEATSRIV